MALGNIGTGKNSILLLKEEPTFAGTITSATSVWLRRKDHSFQRNPSIVKSNYAAQSDIGIAKKAVETVTGSVRFEVDATTIGWLLKWLMGTPTSTIQGASSEYKHVFKWANTWKSCKASIDEGGLGTPLLYGYLGLVPDRLALNMPLYGTLEGEVGFVGKKNATVTAPGSATFPSDDLTIAYNGFSVRTGTAGTTTWAAMNAFTDPYDMRLELSRDIKADNFVSDGTGQTTGITDGDVNTSLNFVSQLTTSHRAATFEAGTEISMAIKLDTGLLIPSGNADNYMIEIILPRVVLKAYNRRASGPGPINPVIDVIPMKDITAGYSTMINLYNNTTAYTDAT